MSSSGTTRRRRVDIARRSAGDTVQVSLCGTVPPMATIPPDFSSLYLLSPL